MEQQWSGGWQDKVVVEPCPLGKASAPFHLRERSNQLTLTQ